jgi:DNA-binding HxlR family transcriptional regulator
MRTKEREKESERPLSRAEATLHPVRLRIVLALQGRQLTTRELRAVLPNVPQATLYRHVNRLHEAGVIRAADHRQVHGTVERTWALNHEETRFSPKDFDRLTPDELAQMFSSFIGGVLDLYDRYAHSPNRDIERDQLVFYGEMAHLTDAEAAEVRTQMGNLVRRYAATPPGEGRRRRLLAVFSVPEVERADGTTEETEG